MSQQGKVEDNVPWGCVGAVLAALILGVVTIWTQLQSGPVGLNDIDLAPVTLENSLLLPAEVYVSEEFDTEIKPLSTALIPLDKEPVNIRVVLKKVRMADGTPIGDDIEGTFHRVFEGEKLYIGRTIGNDEIVYIILNNNTSTDCEVIVNSGLASEQHAGVTSAGNQNVHIGYYWLYDNSNVTWVCGSEEWYWGVKNGDGGPPLSKIVNLESGTLILTLND